MEALVGWAGEELGGADIVVNDASIDMTSNTTDTFGCGW